MKYPYINKLLSLFGLFVVSGCNYLDFVPEKDIQTVETIFEKREDANTWLKTCYSFLNPQLSSVVNNPSFMGADEFVSGDYLRQISGMRGEPVFDGFFIGDGLQMSQKPYANRWLNTGYYAGIRYCNTFLANIDKVYNMQPSEKAIWAAEIKAAKAHIYFELMRAYGAIILVPENIHVGASIEVMQQPRSNFDDCVKAVVDLLDQAIEALPLSSAKEFSRLAYHSKESAATLKAQVLLLAASPQFNGNPAYSALLNKEGKPLYSQKQDREKWKTAALAAEQALAICKAGNKSLITGSDTKQTKLLNLIADLEKTVQAPGFLNQEAIYMVRYNYNTQDSYAVYTLPRVDQSKLPDQYNLLMRGCISPSMKIVETYYTDKGLPIDQDKTWDYASRYTMSKESNYEYNKVVEIDKDVLALHLHREARFYANIAADRCYWQRGKDLSMNNYLIRAYRNELFGITAKTISSSEPQNLTGYWLKKYSYSDVTSKDYATVFQREEAAVIMRLPEVYLMIAEAWNEYEGPSEKVYSALNEIRKRAGLPTLQDAWNNYSKDPSMITRQEGLREIVHREWDVEFAFEGHRYWNLRRWWRAHIELNDKLYGWNVVGENANQFYNNFEGPIVVWPKRKFLSPRDYLQPIEDEEIMNSGCKQNPGW